MNKNTALLLVSVAVAASTAALIVYGLKKKQAKQKKIAIHFI